MGVFYCVLIYLLHFLVKNPPAGYIPTASASQKSSKQINADKDFTAKKILKTRQFYLLWIMFFCGTFAGLKILGQLSSIGKEQALLSDNDASLLVMVYALFNCFGRLICGYLSDKMGRKKMLFIVFLMQVVFLSFFSQFNNIVSLSTGTAFIAFSFGGMLSIFPSITADYFGVKNLGVNYGLIFTAWGVGGVLGPLVGGMIRDHIGLFDMSYMVSVAVCVVGGVLSLVITAPVKPDTADQS